MTLTEEAASYAMDRATTPAQYTALQRAFMAGALDAAKRQPLDTIRECLDFAKTIGTPVEAARVRTTRCPHGVSKLNRCMRCD